MKRKILPIVAALLAPLALQAANPYLPLWEHLPDGEPRVFEDPDNPGHFRAYIIGSHDLRLDSYCGNDIRMWSAPVEDLNDWRDEGPIFTYETGRQWDVMYAPDLVEINRPDGKREYWLYPHSRGPRREAMVCKGSRPDGPFTPVNLNAEGTATTEGSILGFDPSIFVETITDKKDPDYAKGFRAYGYWGFQRSSAAELDQETMYSMRPGTERIPYFIPASTHQGEIRDPKGTTYPALFPDQNPLDFNFFEASSIRKVGNKYVMIFSGFSGPEYGLGNSNSTLRYAYGDTPLGPWRAGGVLVDSRAVVPSTDGSKLATTFSGHNTHGSIQEINGQWYVFYHRPPRGFGFARQAMVAPITIQADKRPVAKGGKVVIRGLDTSAKDGIYHCKGADGSEYTGAEVTSEGFDIYGLDPYKYYSAGIACYLSDLGSMQDAWDIWDNHMPVDMTPGDVAGFKYFGFGGLKKATNGLKPFEGTAKGNETAVNLFVIPQTDESFTVDVWLDGPVDNATWKGKKIAQLTVPASSKGKLTRLTADVADAVDNLDGKHAVYIASNGNMRFEGLGFTRRGETMERPEVPVPTIKVNGKALTLPATPVRSTNGNGITDYSHYEVAYNTSVGTSSEPVLVKIEASCSNPDVKVSVSDPTSASNTVTFDWNGLKKIYHLTPTLR